ncbi:MAG: cell wall hydrolase [Lachnospiraceae bacterium]|nr:cell wall hydrolase [Lachnospiraceae bacterium]
MARSRKLLLSVLSLILGLVSLVQADIAAEASSSAYLDLLNGGVAAIIDPTVMNSSELITVTAEELQLEPIAEKEEEDSTLVMANVSKVLNVREEPNSEAKKVGKLYKDCGGTILERKDGWTKLQSGNLVGWASDQYLLFGEEAETLAKKVGVTTGKVNTQVLNVRQQPGMEAQILGRIPLNYEVEVLYVSESEWVCISYEGKDGYVLAEYLDLGWRVDAGETLDEIKAREAAEMEAKRYKKFSEYTVDEDTLTLLAAIIHCEAGGESYEGQVAVGAVVMNRVRSSRFPDNIHDVIYAAGQFSPAMSGRLDEVLESGKIYDSCYKAAKEALSGVSNVGDMTYFRRNDGRKGLVIGNHVFH